MKNSNLSSPKNSMKIVKTLCRELGYDGLLVGYKFYKQRTKRHPITKIACHADILSPWDRYCLDKGIVRGYL
jgi:hypothetical protein